MWTSVSDALPAPWRYVVIRVGDEDVRARMLEDYSGWLLDDSMTLEVCDASCWRFE